MFEGRDIYAWLEKEDEQSESDSQRRDPSEYAGDCIVHKYRDTPVIGSHHSRCSAY